MSARRLTVMRHAKSSWDDARLSDHQRPLNRRGRAAATAIGRLMAERGWIPDVVFCSSARRTVETWERVGKELPTVNDVRILSELYLPSVSTVLATLQTAQDEHDNVLLICHNPACELLVHRLLGRPLAIKTADTVLLSTSAPDWYDAMGSPHDWSLEGQLSGRSGDDARA